MEEKHESRVRGEDEAQSPGIVAGFVSGGDRGIGGDN